jgi:cellulose 1,4-beta-cellobiosidase
MEADVSSRTRIVSMVTTTALAVAAGALVATDAAAVPAAAVPAAAVPTAAPGNPFAGARGYVDPDWSAAVRANAAQGGTLGPAMSTVAARPTAVWLDSITSIAGTPGRRGLRAHLDAALAQQDAGGEPVVLTLVLYGLPIRSCTRASSGDITDVADYRTRFIDPIAAILAETVYRPLRVAVVVEPDALANALFAHFECPPASQIYQDAIPYALNRLRETPNVRIYLDVAQSNQLGWAETLKPAVAAIRQLADRTAAGVAGVDGFAVNVADYDPVDEPFLDIGMTRNGVSIRQTKWVDWNNHLEESTFVDAMHAALVAAGFPEGIGALVDTSRNGWGGPERPTAVSTLTDVNAFVDVSRVDRRPTRITWCNQKGAGLGEPPRATPRQHIHAYAWIKQPGVSDGTAADDVRCDPNGEIPPGRGSGRPTNALAGAPPRGEWFPAAFAELVRNAFPPVL